jgi:hypothetical protein
LQGHASLSLRDCGCIPSKANLDLDGLTRKVSHHPMILACHCEGRGWKCWGDSNLKSKFWGRSIQLDPVGTITVQFDDGEVFQWSKVFCNCDPL